MSSREARPWPPRRALPSLVGVAVLGTLLLGGTFAWDRYEERRSTERSCAALRAPVEGLGALTWSNGRTMSEGNWSTVLLYWHDHLGESEKARATEAVRADDEGHERLLADAEEVIRPDVERLLGQVAPMVEPDLRGLDVSAQVAALQRYLIGACHIAP